MVKELYGGYDNVGASKQDFKNFQRDLKAFIGGSDAQIFVDNFEKKKKIWSSFFFEFETDADGCLNKALWCDPICIKNYTFFGDMVTFDTTFRTNKYVFFIPSSSFCCPTGFFFHVYETILYCDVLGTT